MSDPLLVLVKTESKQERAALKFAIGFFSPFMAFLIGIAAVYYFGWPL